MKKLTLISTWFEKHSSAPGAQINLLSVFKDTLNGKWKTAVTAIRSSLLCIDQMLQHKEELVKQQPAENSAVADIDRRIADEQQLVQTLKSRLEGYTPAGVFSTRRIKEHMEALSCIAFFDFDHLSLQQAPAVRDALFYGMPSVVCAHLSVSGRGVHCFVRHDLNEIDHWEEHYVQMAQALQRIAGVPCDMACKDITRISYVSYDDQLRQRAWDDTPAFSLARPVVSHLPGDDLQDTYGQPRGYAETVGQTLDRSLPADHTHEEIDRYFTHLLRFYPIDVVGQRHTHLVKIGRLFRQNGYSDADFQYLLEMVDANFGSPSFTRQEIKNALQWCERRIEPLHDLVKRRPGATPAMCQPGTQTLASTGTDDDEGIDIRRFQHRLPTFSNRKDVHLPRIMRRGMKVADNVRSADIVALSMFTMMGAAMPHVSCLYDCGRKTYYPMLVSCVVGPAAAGKSIAMLPRKMLKNIVERFEQDNIDRLKEYELQMAEYEEQRSQKKGRKDNGRVERPEKPAPNYFELIPSTSRSQLVISLMDSHKNGAFLTTTEIDELVAAMGTEYGKFSSLLRQLSEHEEFGSHYKVDEKQYKVQTPKCALLMTGTENQFAGLVNYEDGFGSRVTGYVLPGQDEWMNQAPNYKAVQPSDIFEDMAPQLLEMYDYLKQHPVEMRLSPKQWEKFDHEFRYTFDMGKLEDDVRFHSIIKRSGVTCMRLLSILVAWRTFLNRDKRHTSGPVFATNGELQTAIGITQVLINHEIYLTQLVSERKRVEAVKEPTNVTHIWLSAMPDEFHLNDVVSYVQLHQLGRSRRSLMRDLKKLVAQGDLQHDGTHSPYVKTEKLKELLSKHPVQIDAAGQPREAGAEKSA